MGKNLLGIKELSIEDIQEILSRADYYQEHQSIIKPVYQQRFIANLFLEPSTRTRISFEIAEKKLGAELIDFQSSASSLTKGETLYDTLKTIEAQGVEVAVIRTKEETVLEDLSKKLNIRIINAGEGSNEHPTQALLDLYTIKKYYPNLKDLNVAIIGDIAHSRVARSNYYLLKKLGANLIFSGPSFFMDKTLDGEILPIDEAIKKADVVMMLRIQFERLEHELELGKEEYNRQYGLTKDRIKLLSPHAIILHPAPVNRGIEMDSEIVEHRQSKIFEQIHNGVWIRMAVIERALGGEEEWKSLLRTEKFGIKNNGLIEIF